MDKTLITIFILITLLCSMATSAQIKLAGYVFDSDSKEPLIAASVFEHSNKLGAITNVYGFFSLNIPDTLNAKIEVRYIGYKTRLIEVHPGCDTILHIGLTAGVEIDEVVVSGFRNKDFLNRPETGVIEMPATLSSILPKLMGEADLTRALQLMPGVQSGKEGSSGIYVRGGSSDQNLVLLDGVTVYNPNHIGGFISVFNPSAINYVKLYKSGFPARYGGRLSSVLDIRMKEGNLKHKQGSYSIGTLTGKYSVEGPIKQDTSAYVISIRRTMIDLFLSAFQLIDSNGEFYGGYNLYDVNAKFYRILNDNKKLYFSFYKGNDKIFRRANDRNASSDFPYNTSFKSSNSWGNTAASVRLNKLYSNHTFANYTFGFSRYNYEIGSTSKLTDPDTKLKVGTNESYFNSGIHTYLFKADLNTSAYKNQQLGYGGQLTINVYNPGTNRVSTFDINTLVQSNDRFWGADKLFVPTVNAYVSDEFSYDNWLTVMLGGHIEMNWVNSVSYIDFQPRFVSGFKLGENTSVKTSYSKMQQFMHLVTSNDNALPADLWVPSTKLIKPEKSHQFSLGAYHTPNCKTKIEISVETFFKTFSNLVELKSGSNIVGAGNDWQFNLETDGKGRAYGAEFLIAKKSGSFTGWLAYTISKNERNFTNINKGNWFPYKYDRRHELSLVANYNLSERIQLSATWVYMSGEALTLPKYKYEIDVVDWEDANTLSRHFNHVHYYGGYNNFRTPAYHRLDFNVNFKRKLNYGVRTWSIGAYNAYNRKNSFYIYVDKDKNNNVQFYSYSLFPIIPSISYQYDF